jgi:beta-glucosidase
VFFTQGGVHVNINTLASLTSDASDLELKNRELAYSIALEGIVLLSNDGTLPIKPGPIALFGAGAEFTAKGGTGSGEVNERHSVSIMEGLEKAGYKVTTKHWLYEYAKEFRRAEDAHRKEVAKCLRKLDLNSMINLPFRHPYGPAVTDLDIQESAASVCVYVVARQFGEFFDRDMELDYKISEEELANIRKVASSYAKTILVINSGSSMDMSLLDEIDGINAVIFFCQQGLEGGSALASILSGKDSPSGKLSSTWAKRYEDFPNANEYSSVSGKRDEAFYKEGIYVGYRYFDTFKVEPRFPFGFGLGYTTFEMKPLKVSLNGSTATVQVEVGNAGIEHSGKEVAELYLSCPPSELERPYQELAAFAKTDLLAPGQTQELTLEFDFKSFASYNESSSCFVLEPGDYCLRLGSSSRNTKPCAVITLDREAVISKHQSICACQDKIDELKAPTPKACEDTPNAPHLKLDPSAFKTMSIDYAPLPAYVSEEAEKFTKGLTVDEMVDIVCGVGMFGAKSHFIVPGAAGSTTSSQVGKGLANISLSDGPAGLRLQRVSVATDKGEVKMVDPQLNGMKYLPKLLKKLLFGDPRKGKLVYIYTTAFPVGTALAQTWNPAILEAEGKAVGAEMTRYGVSVWLAPSLNIHRNPLCGRNFEYFSEDPILSGKMAAAIIRGTQSVDGCFATIKHFACNNQETNRNKMSSNLSERALREIYLRGFEIAVKEGSPACVMTSYNKINGVYSSNSHDLCTKVLRNEWSFNGVVMTDWFATWKRMGLADSALAIAAGNDMIMPGGKGARKEMKDGLKAGSVTVDAIFKSCANIVSLIMKSVAQKELDKQLK